MAFATKAPQASSPDLMAILVDTGILYALADVDDDWHERARAFVETCREALVAPVTVLPEVAYLLHKRLGPRAEAAFVRSLARGELAVEALADRDLPRCLELCEAHPDMGFVDASLVAMAERRRLRTLATTDRRHFASVRPRHVEQLTLLP